jgi:predicted ribosomally synthesized peptide with nif11-like leader
MSTENVVAFRKKTQADLELRVAVRALGADIDAIVNLGSKEGFDFTKDEVISVFKDKDVESGYELSDGELDQISGGDVPPTVYW